MRAVDRDLLGVPGARDLARRDVPRRRARRRSGAAPASRSSPGRAPRPSSPPSASGGPPRRGPDPALELVADHPDAAADVALLDRPGIARPRAPRRRAWRPDVEAVDVVERAVVRLADHGQRPKNTESRACARAAWATSASRTTPTECVLVIPITPPEQPRLADPLEPGQLAVAVEAVAAGEHGLRERRRPRAGRRS